MRTLQEVIDFVSDQMQNTNIGYQAKLLGFVKTIWDEVRFMHDWSWNYREGFLFRTVAAYSDGTVAVTNGSVAIVGTDTTFTSSMVGRKFRVQGDTSEYVVIDYTDATNITLDRAFTGTTDSSVSYDIYQPSYYLAGDFEAIYYIYQENSGIRLKEWSERDFYTHHPTPMSKGTPELYYLQRGPIGNVWLGTGLLSFSVDGTANTGKQVTVRGVSDNVETYEVLTLNATQAISTTNSYSYISKISKEVTTTPVTITLPDALGQASGNTFALGPETTNSDFQKITLWDYPSEAIDMRGSYKRNPYTLSQLTDTVPDILDSAIKLGTWALALNEDEQYVESTRKNLEYRQAIARAIGLPVKSSHARLRLTLPRRGIYDRRYYGVGSRTEEDVKKGRL